MNKTSTYPLRLPASLKAAGEKLSKDDGTSLNQWERNGWNREAVMWNKLDRSGKLRLVARSLE